jgi:hypothetical protein
VVSGLPSDVILVEGEAPADGSHVYFLCQSGECVYVGQSTRLRSRLRQHLKSGKEWDNAYYLPVHNENRLRSEAEWIVRLSPKYNGDAGRPTKEAADIRSRKIEIRLTEGEYKEFSHTLGRGFTTWIRDVALKALRRRA